jgi:hypothetical protein
VVGEVEQRLRLAGEAQRPAVAPADQARRPGALRQCPQQRLGPEMLVDVEVLWRGVTGGCEAVQ